MQGISIIIYLFISSLSLLSHSLIWSTSSFLGYLLRWGHSFFVAATTRQCAIHARRRHRHSPCHKGWRKKPASEQRNLRGPVVTWHSGEGEWSAWACIAPPTRLVSCWGNKTRSKRGLKAKCSPSHTILKSILKFYSAMVFTATCNKTLQLPRKITSDEPI